MKRIAIMALEGLDDEVFPVDAIEVVETLEEQPETEMLEMAETATEIEGHDEGMDEAIATADTLTEVRDQMGEAIEEEGGLSEPAAAAIEIAVEAMCTRIGFKAGRSGFALENFKAKTSRATATKVAMESITDKIKKIWEQIVAAFNTAIEMVKAFFNKLFDATIKLSARAEKLMKLAESKKGKTAPADAKVSAGKFQRADNKVVGGSDFVKKFGDFVEVSPGATSATFSEQIAEKIGNDVNALLDSVKDSAAFDTKLEALTNTLDTDIPHAKSKSQVPEGMRLGELKMPMSDKSYFALVIVKGTPAGKVGELLSKVKTYVAESTGATEVEGDGKVAPLTAEQAADVAGVAKKHMDTYVATKASVAKINVLQKKVQAKAKTMITEAGKDVAVTKNLQIGAAAARMIISMTSTTLAQLRSIDINITKGALDYCDASLSAIGKVKEAAAA
jgi:hypothetical protein